MGKCLKYRARELRENPTEAESVLWEQLRAKRLDGHKFRRQAVIGPYIVDFVCLRRLLVVEVDGNQHEFERDYDGRRSAWLEERGFMVVRFWNEDVLRRTSEVIEVIRGWLGVSTER